MLHPTKQFVIGIRQIAALTAIVLGPCAALAATDESVPKKGAPLPSVAEMAAAQRDLWGKAALRQPDGPSYEFFKDLLPPLRYVNTEFRHYPIVLSAPLAAVKARWVSDGSAVNARANKKPMWKEIGVPVSFHVGEDGARFGEDLDKLRGPHYARGYLPIVHTRYGHSKASYEQEILAPVHGALADHGAVVVRFTVKDAPGIVAARVGAANVRATGGVITNSDGDVIVGFDLRWQWLPKSGELLARLEPGRAATLLIFTKPLATPAPAVTEAFYREESQACIDCWEALVKRGAVFDIPEPIVNNASRSLVIGNFLIAVGDRMHYSAGNAYDHLYEAECGDAVRSLMLFGYTAEARRMVGPLLDFYRKATQYHVAGHKLQLLAHYYWITRDAEYVRAKEPVWKAVADFIIASRKTANGLLPKDNYAGDINQQVYSLNSNANCWRGLRDLAAVLDDLGDKAPAKELRREADDFRKAILIAVAKSERRDVEPPFIPNALFGVEEPYDTIPATRLGSYYNLMAPYIIGSGVFGPGSEREAWMIEYLRRHGGLAMGMIRSMPHQGEFAKQPGVNVLYGLRYQLKLLERDERDRALVGFYGHLAQGMTRDTFLGGEGSRFVDGDRHGRSFYLPPNSAANAMFLTTLRYLLIQDWDTDDDGKPDTLRLLYGAPGRWLKDGATLKVERAPTAFGEVSFQVKSRLSKGEVEVTVQPPPRQPERFMIRLPLPASWMTASASIGISELRLSADGAVDVTDRTEAFTIRFRVKR
jgi:hypothetical protein